MWRRATRTKATERSNKYCLARVCCTVGIVWIESRVALFASHRGFLKHCGNVRFDAATLLSFVSFHNHLL